MDFLKMFFYTLFSKNNTAKPTKQALVEEQENLFKQVLDTSSVAIFLVNLEGRITLANHCMSEMFLYPNEALIGKEYIELVHQDEQILGRQNMQALFENQLKSADLERIYKRGDGSIFWGRFTGKVFYDAQGTKVGLVSVIANVDERKYVQHCERHHKHILQKITSTLPLSSLLHVMVKDIESIHHNRIGCSILLLDETQHQLILGATSNALQSLSTSIIRMSHQSRDFLTQILSLEPKPHLFQSLEAMSWWSEAITCSKNEKAEHCSMHPITSATGNTVGFLLLCSLFNQPLAPREIKFVESEVQFIALAIEKSKSDAKLKLAASVFTHAREGIIITDPYGTIIEANETFVHTTGYLKEELIGNNPRILKSGRQEMPFYIHMWHSILTQGSWQGEIWNRRKNGSIYAEILTISAIKDTEGEIQNFVALFTDISTMKEHEKALEHLAQHDALTSLPNRLLLKDRLSQAMAETERYHTYLAVLYVDLDGFKEINDTYGHSVGDDLLIAVSKRISALLRKNETLARLGGDEFVVLLTDLKEVKECESIVVRILEAMNEEIEVHGIDLRVTASIGISICPHDTTSAETLIENADKAMYAAKQAGKNRYVFFEKSLPA